ncbi:hypothetical protein ABT294_05220 [Nonomuraea sp. NPDC000554]|uniref:hypothetical protein n=1 Tax=Nonomuraea sp. NPDC000554 TaxID=3154259 RepID=UPI003319F694
MTHSSLERAASEHSEAARAVAGEATFLREDLAALGDRWGGGEVGATIGALDKAVLRMLYDRCADLAEWHQGDADRVTTMSATHRGAELDTVATIEQTAADA